ncbi:MAG: uroporphyrinogen-III C-methyltransferase [Candidatus Tyrphobacter sp.]
MSGRVALVGAGPGDPELLTLGAVHALRAADVVLYDALVSDAVLAFAPPTCERIYVGKRGGDHAVSQNEIETLMARKAREGKVVVRLKGGDPFVFGRGAEEAESLRDAGIAFAIVPGVTSAIAVPAYAGIPVTRRGLASSFVVATGHEDPQKDESAIDWTRLAGASDTLVFLMGLDTLESIAARLQAAGLDPATPAAVIANGTRPTQRSVVATLEKVAQRARDAGLRAPAVLVVGKVVALRERLQWYDRGALFGKRVLITRPCREASHSARLLLSAGMEPIVAPTIEIGPPDDVRPALRAVEEAAQYAWIVFLSRYGAEAFFDRLRERGKDVRALAPAKVAAIGAKTAHRLHEFGLIADLTSEHSTSEDVARDLLARTAPGDRVLIYAAQEGRDVVRSVLEENGRLPVAVAAYKTAFVSDPEFASKVARADVLTFTSPSTVRAFAALLGGSAAAAEAARDKIVACIGPVTADEARGIGLHVDATSHAFSAEDMLAAIASRLTTPA